MELNIKQKQLLVESLEFDSDDYFDYKTKWEFVYSNDKDYPYLWKIAGHEYDYLTSDLVNKIMSI